MRDTFRFYSFVQNRVPRDRRQETQEVADTVDTVVDELQRKGFPMTRQTIEAPPSEPVPKHYVDFETDDWRRSNDVLKKFYAEQFEQIEPKLDEAKSFNKKEHIGSRLQAMYWVMPLSVDEESVWMRSYDSRLYKPVDHFMSWVGMGNTYFEPIK